jgi:hypothetical protein
MDSLSLSLSQLEVEPLDLAINAPEQGRSLEALTIPHGGVTEAAILIISDSLPVNTCGCCSERGLCCDFCCGS